MYIGFSKISQNMAEDSIYRHTSVRVCLCVSDSMCICVSVYTCVSVYVYVCVCMFMCSCACERKGVSERIEGVSE